MLRRAVELGVSHIDTAAFYFSPLRSANELINTALAPYPDGLVIATRRAGELEPVLAVARSRGATPAQVRLAWTLAQGSHVLAIRGTSSLAHLGENVAAGALRLTDEELALLSSSA